MAATLVALSVDARDPIGLARFWSGVLGWESADQNEGAVALRPTDDTGFAMLFSPTGEPGTGRNRMHFDLTSDSSEDQRQTVERAVKLGGRHIDVGQTAEEPHVVLADPEGNEFCVIEPGNRFLADCGFVGALACDGSQQVGYFWGAALGWPLVWDRGQETAIRAPDGGPKITWGGPPLMPRTGRDRLRFELAPSDGTDRLTEAERLRSLGASWLDVDHDGTRWLLADPDGNEFHLLDAV